MQLSFHRALQDALQDAEKRKWGVVTSFIMYEIQTFLSFIMCNIIDVMYYE